MLDCKTIYEKKMDSLKQRLSQGYNREVLVIINATDNYGAKIYTHQIEKDCEKVGITYKTFSPDYFNFMKGKEEIEFLNFIEYLIQAEDVGGIILQNPLPEYITNEGKEKIKQMLSWNKKDIDCFSFPNCNYLPATVWSALNFISLNNENGRDLSGQVICVVGRSKNLGLPLTQKLIERGATVISCNSKTPLGVMKEFVRTSDVIVSVVGKAGLIKADWISNWQVCVDVGISQGSDGKLSGDFEKKIYDRVAVYTPVPGGIGLTTRTELLENFINAIGL